MIYKWHLSDLPDLSRPVDPLPFPLPDLHNIFQFCSYCTVVHSHHHGWRCILSWFWTLVASGFISSYCSGISGTMFLHCMARCWLLLVLLLQVNTISKVTGLLPTDYMFPGSPIGRRPRVLAPGDDSEAEVQHGVDQTAPGRQSLISHHLNFKMLRIFWWAIEALSQALIFIFH